MSAPSRIKEASLTHARALELFALDLTTGELFRRLRWIDRPAGYIGTGGYLRVSVGENFFLVHRLVWFYVHGGWPRLYLDHINGDRTDNRIENLREADSLQNIANRAAQNGRPLKGITFQDGRWQAQIRHKGRNLYLGRFDSTADAAAVYAAKAREIHGAFARGP